MNSNPGLNRVLSQVDTHDLGRMRHLHLLHLMNLFFLVAAIAQSTLIWFTNQKQAAGLIAFFALIHGCIFALVKQRRLSLARFIFILQINLGTLVLAWLLGPNAHVEFNFFPAMIAPFLFGSPKEKNIPIFGFILSVFGFFLVGYLQIHHPIEVTGNPEDFQGNYVAPFAAMVLIWGFSLGVWRNVNFYSNQILIQIEQRQKLDKQMLGIRDLLIHHSDDEMYSEVLKYIREIFQSPFGYFGYIRSSDGALIIPSLTYDNFSTQLQNTTFEYLRPNWKGVWGEILSRKIPVIKNAIHQTLYGHVKLFRSMGAPILFGDQLIGQLHVANGPHDYTETDLSLLVSICNVIAPSLKSHLDRVQHDASRAHFEAELQEAMEDASQNAERFKALVDGSPDDILRFDINGLCLDLKSSLHGTQLFNANEFLNKLLQDFPLPTEFKNSLGSAIRTAIQSELVVAIDTQIETDSGEKHLEINVSPTASNEVVCMIRDVTEKHRMAAEVKSNLLDMQRLNFELVRQQKAIDEHAIVAFTDLAGKITFVNEKFCAISGFTREELIGKNHRIVKSEMHTQEFYESMWGTISSGQVWHGKICNRSKSGAQYWVDSTIVPFLNEAGLPTQYMAIRTDITLQMEHEAALAQSAIELKQNNQELEIARDAALASTRSKSDFLATMSHEIRTPMNGILGMTHILLESNLSGQQRENALTIQNSADALLTLINDILDFSKIEAGKLTIEPIPFHLETALQEMCDLLAFQASDKKLAFLLRTDPKLPTSLLGDPGRIRQILINLAGNAIKFTASGSVTIHLQSLGLDEKHQHRIRFEITDTGMGMTEATLTSLFQPFTQADASTTRRFGGTGLGLSISHRLVAMMGGKLNAQSEFGKGSTFFFELSFPEAQKSDWTAVASTPFAGQRILIVEDHRESAEITRDVLISAGMRVEWAMNGQSALTLIEKANAKGDPFVVAIVDWLMPVMDGEEFAKQTKERFDSTAPILIMLTASGFRGLAKRMADVGYSGFLVKPLAPSILLQAVREALERSHTPHRESLPLITRHRLTEAHTLKEKSEPTVLGLRILLAEDNVVNQKVALQMLRKQGCTVDVAANGVEAAHMAISFPYDLILMDCQMPELDGFGATRRIRDTVTQKIPIIAMTANAMQGDKEKCLEAGMDDYLSKPVKPDTLIQMLVKWSPVKTA